MTKTEVSWVYEECREKAIRVVKATLRVADDVAEDAVQTAALELIEKAAEFKTLTPSYFIQRVVSRAKDVRKSENARIANRERPVGAWYDLADVEEADASDRLGRTKPAGTADGASWVDNNADNR